MVARCRYPSLWLLALLVASCATTGTSGGSQTETVEEEEDPSTIVEEAGDQEETGSVNSAAAPGVEVTDVQASPVAAEGPIARGEGWPTSNWREWPNLSDASPESSTAVPAPQALLRMKGSARRGRSLLLKRKNRVGCVDCHVIPRFPRPGDIGPSLIGYGSTTRSRDWLLNFVWDARNHNAATIMPPLGAHGVLSQQEVVDVVEFLFTLKRKTFGKGFNDPAKRAPPSPSEHSLNPILNPAMFALDEGKRLHSLEAVPGAKICVGCHIDPATNYKGATNRFPKWSVARRRVIGVEQFVVAHAKKESGHDWPLGSDENLAMSIWLRQFSNGIPLGVTASGPAAQAALIRGKKYARKKIGQWNLACVDCHEPAAGKWLGGRRLVKAKALLGSYPAWVGDFSRIWDIRKRMQRCNIRVRANALEADAPEYGDLELYLAVLNKGVVPAVPGLR